jgi:uncharacterized membrane protein
MYLTLGDPSDLTEIVSLTIFAVCFIITIITSGRSFKRGNTAREVRSEYRRSWAAAVLKAGNVSPVADLFRNNLTILTAMLGGLVVAAGLVLNAIGSATTMISLLHLGLILVVMIFAFFHLLMEIRTSTYIPLIFSVDGKLIEKHEKMTKEEYLGRLMDNTYDDFSSTINALFYIAALLFFPISPLLFIFITLLLTYLFVRRDISEKSRIEIF